MKKILLSLSIIAIASSVVIGGTRAIFSDTETSTGNTFTAGTIDIAVDGNKHWQGSFVWDNIEPGEDFEISFNITNEGKNPLRLWEIIKCLVNDENGVVEPEQAWYDDNNGGVAKSDLDSVIIYEMEVDGNMVVNKEAGITLDKIKDSHIGLLKLDQSVADDYTGPETNGTGILNPGGSVNVVQRYYLPGEVENWAQSDSVTFVIELVARQTNAPEPLQQMSFIDNKNTSGDWSAIEDERIGILKYDYTAPEFNYNFYGVGLIPNKNYCLMYRADKGTLPDPTSEINRGYADSSGVLELTGSKDLGDLPNIADKNYPTGAKIWLTDCTSWTPINFLFDNWPGFINYRQGERPNEDLGCDYEEEPTDNGTSSASGTNTIYFSDLGAASQYGYYKDYSTSTVAFIYATSSTDRLSGTITATGLKHYATYQMKLEGKPTCLTEYTTTGDDTLNSYIGSIGRWWDNTTNSNATDAQKEANPGHCYTGYLVWDFITADKNGNVTKQIETANSYHVLRCAGGTCAAGGDAYLTQPDSDYPNVYFCAADDVNGELEHDSTIPCNGLTLTAGDYDLRFILNEESFHQGPGTWTAVMDANIQFEIE